MRPDEGRATDVVYLEPTEMLELAQRLRWAYDDLTRCRSKVLDACAMAGVPAYGLHQIDRVGALVGEASIDVRRRVERYLASVGRDHCGASVVPLPIPGQASRPGSTYIEPSPTPAPSPQASPDPMRTWAETPERSDYRDDCVVVDYGDEAMAYLGMLPVVGAVFDAGHAGAKVWQGKWGDAALYGLAALPGIGDVENLFLRETEAARLERIELEIAEAEAKIAARERVLEAELEVEVVRLARTPGVPDEAYDVLTFIDTHNGSPPRGFKGRSVWDNDDLDLPVGDYREYDIEPKPTGEGERRTARRFVVDLQTSSVWYTEDHYRNFRKMR